MPNCGEVQSTELAGNFVTSRGGVVFVRAKRSRCCSGTLTTLGIDTVRPMDVAESARESAVGIEVRYAGGASGQPQKLVIELRGKKRRRLAAYWDGCAYKY